MPKPKFVEKAKTLFQEQAEADLKLLSYILELDDSMYNDDNFRW